MIVVAARKLVDAGLDAALLLGFGRGVGLNLPVSYLPPHEVMEEALGNLQALRADPALRKFAQQLTVAIRRFYEGATATDARERHRLLGRGAAMLRRDPVRSGVNFEVKSASPWQRADGAGCRDLLNYAAWGCSLAYDYASTAEGTVAMSYFRAALGDIERAAERMREDGWRGDSL